MASTHLTRLGPPEARGPVLLVSSVGGHFTELEFVADALEIAPDERHWVVPRHIQTEERLSRSAVTWSPLVQSREYGKALGNVRFSMRVHRELRPRMVVSTGAAQAGPHLLAAARWRTPIVFAETVARLDGPSVTGRLAARLPNTTLLAPQPGWPAPWVHELDTFSAFDVTPHPLSRPLTSAMVALGSERFSFHHAVAAVERALPAGVDVTWQIGDTECADGVERNRWLTANAMSAAMASADVVITHGGAGSILTALAAGKVPVAVPRRGTREEACDDHQARMVEGLARRGLVVAVDQPEDLTIEHVRRAAALAVTRRNHVSTISAGVTDQIVA